jgi:hypothetical protein
MSDLMGLVGGVGLKVAPGKGRTPIFRAGLTRGGRTALSLIVFEGAQTETGSEERSREWESSRGSMGIYQGATQSSK